MKKSRVLRNIIVSIFFTWLVYSFYNIEFIRSNVGDKAFDLLNEYYLASKSEKLDAPNVFLFKIDDYYLTQKELLNKRGELKYGYLFPRNHIADFIKKFDAHLKKEIENKEDYPKMMFIDFDMSYSSDIHNKKLTEDDKYLLEVLKQDRPYIIYFPKTSSFNIIETSNDKVIQEKIKSGKIVLVSISFKVAVDDITRRYEASRKYYNQVSKEDNVYTFVGLEVFKQYKSLENTKNQDDFTQSKIIYKDYQNDIENKDTSHKSFWQNFRAYSASKNLDELVPTKLYNSVIYLGGTHSNSDDTFSKDFLDRKISGIEAHANALMTIFYFDGKLKDLDIWLSLLIISLVMLLCEYISLKYRKLYFILNKIPVLKYIVIDKEKMFVLLVFVILILISIYLLSMALWFNWLIPSLTISFVAIIRNIEIYKRVELNLAKKYKNKKNIKRRKV